MHKGHNKEDVQGLLQTTLSEGTQKKNVIARIKTNYSMQECAVSSGGTVICCIRRMSWTCPTNCCSHKVLVVLAVYICDETVL